jgi:hypothetical protein
MNRKLLSLFVLLLLTLSTLACLPCGLLGGKEAAEPTSAATSAAVAAATAAKPTTPPTPTTPPEAAPAPVAGLGEEQQSEQGGFAFQSILGYTIEGDFGLVGMEAPDADPEIGPALMLQGGVTEGGTTSQQLFDDFAGDVEADVQISEPREITVGGVPALAADLSLTSGETQAAGRAVFAAVTPTQSFLVLGIAPGDRWDNELAPLFDAVLASVRFFEPGAASEQSTGTGEVSGGGAVGAGGEIRQWATSATASSEYGRHSRTASEATGAPNTFACGEMGTAWQSERSDTVEWIELRYDVPVYPTEVNVVQSNLPSDVVLVELIDTAGSYQPVYAARPERIAECPYTLSIAVDGASYQAVGVKVTIDQSVTEGVSWNAIDAVELVGTASVGVAAPPAAPQTGPASDVAAGSFYFELAGDKEKKVEGGTVMDYTTADEYRVALVEEGALYSVVLYLPFDVAPGQIELRPFDKSASPYGPTATVVSGAFSYLAEGGTVVVESVGNGTITGIFAFTAAHEMDPARRVTATGAFNQIPLVKK